MYIVGLRPLSMYTGDGTWYRMILVKIPVARFFALEENAALRFAYFKAQHASTLAEQLP